MKSFLFTLVLFFAVPALASIPESPAREAILLDVGTGTVLYEKHADQRTPTASMSKTITAYMVFEALKQGRLQLDQKIPISERAWKMQGSKSFVELGNSVKVEDLIRGMIIQSGNDATVALAEAVGGTEDGFASMATARAHELGMKESNFTNATGWPDPNHYSTARDLATLALHIMRDFPEYYHYYSEREFTYHGIKQQNRNPLLSMNIGADGLKTGHTAENGYGLIGSAIQNGRRLLLVVNGLPDEKARADEAARLMQWGFSATATYPLVKKGDVLDEATIWLGQSKTVPLVIGQDVTLSMSREARRALKAEVVLQEPVPAPVLAGQELGKLRMTMPDGQRLEYPLTAKESVSALGFVSRLKAKFNHFVLGEKL
jgi:serine-type D-Ala-D-Ala carboxypeptidase (penicillin-binding protein 5/6)